jgi:dynein heavy chain
MQRQKSADENKKVVTAESEVVGKKASEAEAIETDAQAELDAAEPEVKAAQAALNSIQSSDLVELKSLNAPKPGVVSVMQVVFILLGDKKGPDWKTMQSRIKNPAVFLRQLTEYDVDNQPDAQFNKVRKDYFKKPEYNKETITNLSKCAGSLYSWTVATARYQELMKKVKPKMGRLKEVQTIAADAKAELKKKTDQLGAVLAEVAALNEDLNNKKSELGALESTIERCTGQLGRAETLVVLLADEGIRWAETVDKIQLEIDALVGNVFLSCACIAYYGGFTGDYRKKLTDSWTAEAKERNIPCSDIFSLAGVMGDPVTIRGW